MKLEEGNTVNTILWLIIIIYFLLIYKLIQQPNANYLLYKQERTDKMNKHTQIKAKAIQRVPYR
jgi:hypothetical protein